MTLEEIGHNFARLCDAKESTMTLGEIDDNLARLYAIVDDESNAEEIRDAANTASCHWERLQVELLLWLKSQARITVQVPLHIIRLLRKE